MATLKGIFAVLKFLPELVSFLKLLVDLTEKGVEKIEIMNAVKKIGQAFNDPDPKNRARRLNDVFRN